MKQVLVIHGGTPHASYADFINHLQTKEVKIERLKYQLDWKDALAADLGEDYEVLVPRMPNGSNPKYNEWKIWFERILPVCHKNLILVGHSLGGIFLAKYLAENNAHKKLQKVILVAAPYDATDDESLGDFNLPHDLSRLNNQADQIILIHSRDDVVVPFDHVAKYHAQLPKSQVIEFTNNGHFIQEHFPEIVKIIQEKI